jgi:general secretion pathway protein D
MAKSAKVAILGHPWIELFISSLVLLYITIGKSSAERRPVDQQITARGEISLSDRICQASEAAKYNGFEEVTAGGISGHVQPSASPIIAQAKEGRREDGEPSRGKKSSHSVIDTDQAKGETPDPKEETDKVNLNFEDAELSEVVRTLASLLKLNYILDPNIKGKVTINTAGAVDKKDLLSVFFQILEVNGLTAVKQGQLYRVLDTKEASRMPIAILKGQDQREVPPEERIIIQIIPLRFVSTQEMTKLITPFVSATGAIVSSEAAKTLLVVDKGLNILKILKLVEAFDVDVFAEFTHSFYKVQYMDVESLVRTLNQLFYPLRGGREPDVRFIALDRLNTLLTITSNPRTLLRVQDLIQKLDVPGDEVQPQVYVYSVKNGVAKELSAVLNSVFGLSAGEGKRRGGAAALAKPTNPLMTDYLQQKQEQKAEEKEKSKIEEKPSTEAIAPGSLRGEIKITADETRNALIIEATPRDYRVVERVLERLDVLPRQVLIEATLAEITLDKSLDLGVEWNYVNAPSSATRLQSGSIGATGLKFVIGQTERWTAALNALASEDKVKILSSPSVLASDNKTAKIEISREIPVASAQYQYPTAATQPLLETTIEYRDTGVILKVTPHINESGLVSMDISQEVSEQSAPVLVGGSTYPSFFKRGVQTTLTVNHRQTIVIGGLMGNRREEQVSGIPCLVNLPALGWIFGEWKTGTSRTELVMVLTPHIVANLEDAEAISKEFQDKLGGALKYFENRPETPTWKSRTGVDMLPEQMVPGPK